MTISSIRHWQNSPSDSSQKKDLQDKLQNLQQSFHASLFDLFAGTKQFDIFGGSTAIWQNSFLSGADSMAEIEQKLQDVSGMGMQKVLAAQLQAPLPFADRTQKKSDNDFSGLGMVADLTVQMQMIRAGESLNRFKQSNSMSLQSFTESMDENNLPRSAEHGSNERELKIRYFY